jgi:SAM-dependent methyltransferase
MTTETGAIEQWDRYWAYGNLHSFSQMSSGNYHGAVAAYWRACFAVADPGSRILDVATGNGAIALLALEASDSHSKAFTIHGIDLADIEPAARIGDPAVAERLGRIHFHGRTGAEALPFDDGSFDLVCSQFGLEYSDLSRSFPEIARTLRPRGRLALIMHHADSVLLRAAHEELRQLDYVLDDVKLYLRARNLLRAMAEAHRGTKNRAARRNPKLEKKRRALHDAMATVRRAAESSPNPNMLLGPAQYVREIFAAADRSSADELLKWLDEALRRVSANRRRLQDMIDAAMDEAHAARLRELAVRSGFRDIDLVPFHEDDGAMLGWRLEAWTA